MISLPQTYVPKSRPVDIHMVAISAARRFARRAHGDQMYGSFPYLYHLDKVADILFPYSASARVLGYLHDVKEDTQASDRDIRLNFGAHMLECCQLITDPPGDSRAERKAALNIVLAAVPPEHHIVLIVKAADRLVNVRQTLMNEDRRRHKMYQVEHAAFRAAAYRPGLCDQIWSELNRAILVNF